MDYFKGKLTGFIDVNGVGISNGDKVIVTKGDGTTFKGEIVFELGAFMVTVIDKTDIIDHYEDNWNDHVRTLQQFAWEDEDMFDSDTGTLAQIEVINPQYEI